MAAPPKPSTPPAANANANANAKSKKKKVTPAQVAFLVDRYLADNGFHAALSAFRSDAAHLFSPHRAKLPPKGLLPLADILHDYIALKEARLAVDSAMTAMHSLVSTYYAASPAAPALTAIGTAQPSSPPLVPPLFVAPHAASPPPLLPQGAAGPGYASPLVHHHYAHASAAVAVHTSSDLQPTKKRKPTRKPSSASKKPCAASLDPKGKATAAASQLSQPASAPAQSSSVAKSLFGPQLHSPPCTPQQDQPPACPAAPSPAPATAQCSLVSSKTLIVSPLKGGAYYAVERSYHVSSPLKPAPATHCQRTSKREHVKGKLDFDSTTDAGPGPSDHMSDKTSTSSDGDNQEDGFEIDFTNLDLFDGDFSFSELLLDFDLDTDGVHCQDPSASAQVHRLEPAAKTADPVLPDAVKPVAADATEDFISSQGATSVTSVRAAITKRIKIVSPVKGRAAY